MAFETRLIGLRVRDGQNEIASSLQMAHIDIPALQSEGRLVDVSNDPGTLDYRATVERAEWERGT